MEKSAHIIINVHFGQNAKKMFYIFTRSAFTVAYAKTREISKQSTPLTSIIMRSQRPLIIPIIIPSDF